MADPFADKAKDWDAGDFRSQLSSHIGGAMVARVPFAADMRVMDLGAGTGLVTGQIAPRVGKVTAVDTSAAMLAQLTAKPELKGKVEAVEQDIVHHPLGRTFDAVISAMAMHHIEDTAGLAKSLAGHTHPGAWLALADLDSEDGTFHEAGTEGVFHHGFDREALGAHLEGAGFTDVTFSTVFEVERRGRPFSIFLVTARRGAEPASP